ncbi:4-amino-4-deoxy-L-arabinose transferase [Klenkia marina]|uniref:4-amino-4-deoxy-L-arabinose transferase n=1 Tax=Klenkia marina TaxID=1960309 RepID=A0A1G4YUM2_9ACTN|nr:glycosyltransferase family 39 protein [Klenkia marina]SCX57081.1 4-amino-4-deoxy-L-arabinose transferase [Klenkia marina]
MTVLDAAPTAPAPPEKAPDRARSARRPRPDQLALAAVLAGAAALYSIGLARSGWGNAFYAGAAQAGSSSWSAWFYGASDAPGSVTVDKPPAALWVMGLSARVFGVSPWSVLLPQAAMGVLAVALLAATVRRAVGPWPGVLAGLLLALTPVATLMFRYDNPDALLTLLCVLAAWAVGRALADGRTRWLVLAGAVVGLAFLTKSLQAFLVLPGLAGAYLVAGPPRSPRRLLQLVAAGAALLVSAGWWIAVVRLVPRADRPWVGGTTDDDPLSLALGYNGLGRLSGDESSGGGGVHRSSSSIWRLVGSGGDEAGWLLPVAVLALVTLLVLTARAGRTDRVRGAALLWGGWLLVTAGVLSVMKGIEHSYYAVQLAPAVAALVALGGAELWRAGRRRLLAAGLAVAVATAGATAALHWHHPAPSAVLVAVLVVLLVVALVGLRRGRRRAFLVPAVLALCLGPSLWSVSTAAGQHQSSNVYADPPPVTAAGWHVGRPDGAGVTAAAADLVRTGGAGFTWAAATVGHHGADLQLATGQPVMDIGGFSGQDPTTTLPQFQDDVAQHRIHYYVAGTGGGPDSVRILHWVRAHGTKVDVGDTEMYDLSGLAARG